MLGSFCRCRNGSPPGHCCPATMLMFGSVIGCAARGSASKERTRLGMSLLNGFLLGNLPNMEAMNRPCSDADQHFVAGIGKVILSDYRAKSTRGRVSK